ncbi:hypothetical protein Tco_1378009 [Tanacetum coccineum]
MLQNKTKNDEKRMISRLESLELEKGHRGKIDGKFEGGGGGDNDISCGGNGGRGGSMVERGGRSSKESNNACEEVGGVEKISSTRSKLMVCSEECLEGCVGAGGGEVSGGGDDFKVSKSLLGEIPGVMIGESGGEAFGEDGGAI